MERQDSGSQESTEEVEDSSGWGYALVLFLLIAGEGLVQRV